MNEGRTRRRWWEGGSGRLRILCAAVYSVVLLTIVGYAQLRPVNNWDMVAYVGIARSIGSTDTAALHDEVYELLEASVDADSYRALTATGSERTSAAPFLAETASSSRAFAEQLPFYLVKPAYPLLIAAADQLGMNPFAASVLIASLGYVAFALLLLVWLQRQLAPLVATGLAILIVVSPPFAILARLSTPDSLSLFVIVASAYALAVRRAPGIALGLSLLGILIRPNAAVWAVLLAAYLLVLARGRDRPARWLPIATMVAAIIIYVGLTRWAGYYPYPTLFHHALIEYLPYPAEFESTFGILDYARQYVHELLAFQYGAALLFLPLAAIVLLARRHLGGPSTDLIAGLTVLAILAAAAQWIVYPIEPERILAGQLAVILIGLALTAAGPEPRQPVATGFS